MAKLTYIDQIPKRYFPSDSYWYYKFKDTKRFSPIAYGYEEIPDENDPEYEYFWAEQYRRCIQGYVVENATEDGQDVWIPGRMYFYLNFWIIYALAEDKSRKVLRHPKFTSLDYFKFMAIEMMFLLKKDQLFGKARQKGFSEFIAAMVAYNFLFIPSSQNVIVAGQSEYNEKTMDNVKRGLDYMNDRGYEFCKNTSPNRKNYIKASYTVEEEDDDGKKVMKVKGFMSEVYSISAHDNPQAVSRLTPFFIVYEEVGKWKKDLLKETSEFVKASLEAEGTKTGYQVFIGTGGDMEESVADVKEMMFEPHKFDLMEYPNTFEKDPMLGQKVGCFIPAYEFEIIDDDGNSLVAESIEALMEKRMSKKPKERYRAITQKPIYLTEMFLISSGGFFGEAIVNEINEQRRRIMNMKEQQIARRVSIHWINPNNWHDGVRWEYDEEGDFMITQIPEKDTDGNIFLNLYNAATDSYDKAESETSESKGSCTIYKDAMDMNHTFKHWVARVTIRPDEDEGGQYAFYEATIKLCMMYGGCLNLIEYSNILIFEYYKSKGFEFLLRERPMLVIASYVNEPKAMQRYGVEQSFVPHALNVLKEKLREDNYERIKKTYDIEILDSWAKFKKDPKYNCDITVSTAFNVVAEEDDRDITPGGDSYEEDEDTAPMYVMKNGHIIQV